MKGLEMFLQVFDEAQPLLLDLYPADVAYSLRKLRTDYTGNAIRVRRSIDNTEQDIGFVNNELDTAGLLTFVGAGDGFVTLWYDQSVNGNNATQTDPTTQAKIIESGSLFLENSKPAIRFADDGNDSYNFSRLTNIISVFILTKFTPTDENASCCLFGDVSTFHYLSGIDQNSGLLLDPNFSLAAVRNGNNRINATQTDYTTVFRSISLTNRVLLSMVHLSGAIASRISKERANLGRSYRGTLQEIIIYQNDQTANLINIENNINSHYNVY